MPAPPAQTTVPADVIAGLAAPSLEVRGETALWQQIADRLGLACRTGLLTPGARLPGENQMAAAFGVTRVTMRRALARLQAEGVMHARKGAGIYVRAIQRVDYGNRFRIERAGAAASARTLAREDGSADADEAAALNLEPGAPVRRLVRVRLLDEVPQYLSAKSFPAALIADFDGAYEPHGSVRAVYRANGIYRYRRLETRVTGGFATAEESQALLLTLHAPVLRTAMINVDDAGRHIEYNRGAWPLAGVELLLRNPDEKMFDES